MNIYTVRDNLRNTIAGKEQLLASYNATLYKNFLEGDVLITVKATAEILQINIDELKRILQDVEQCCEQSTADSWKENPDRMGGQFAQDEIDNHGRWI